MNFDLLQISKHAKERYAERIMEKDNKTDIRVFVINNEEKIETDICKMIEYGQLIYSGKSVDLYNKQVVDIYLNGIWVVIVDKHKNNVVTLYSIDLGLGVAFNEQYIIKLLDKLAEAKQYKADVEAEIAVTTDTYKQIIKENEALIAEYRCSIKQLEQQNEGYKEVIDGLQANINAAEQDIRSIVATMIGRKVF